MLRGTTNGRRRRLQRLLSPFLPALQMLLAADGVRLAHKLGKGVVQILRSHQPKVQPERVRPKSLDLAQAGMICAPGKPKPGNCVRYERQVKNEKRKRRLPNAQCSLPETRQFPLRHPLLSGRAERAEAPRLPR